jgi:hypothetical protein
MMKNTALLFFLLAFSTCILAQNTKDIYFNYDELIGIQIESDSTLKVYYNLKGKTENQLTHFEKTAKGIQIGKLDYNENRNVKKLSAEPLEFINGNLYLKKYRMYFYSDEMRKTMESRDCYIVNNQTYFTKKGKIKGDLKKAIKNLRKASVQSVELDSKTTYDKYGIHCIGATEILGMPLK